MSDSDASERVQEDAAGGGADAEWEEWGDGDEEGEDDSTASLFEPARLLSSPKAALAHDASAHGFDLRSYRQQLRLGDYATIKLVNFIRAEVAAGRDPRPALQAAAATAGSTEQQPWGDDSYLQPVLPDDPLLTYEYDDDDDEVEPAGCEGQAAAARSTAAAAGAGAGAGSSTSQQQQVADLMARVAALTSANEQLQLRLAAVMEVALPPELRQELREAAAEDAVFVDTAAATTASSVNTAGGPSSSSSNSAGSGASAAAGPSNSSSSGVVVAGARRRLSSSSPGGGAGGSAAAAVDAAYFDSYSYADIHHDMLADKAYQAVLTRNPGLLSGAVVLDVGCGTGILSMFAAKGGAAAVVGLDASSRIAGLARQVVAANGLDAASGGPVTIINSKVEEAADIGHSKVSVIVSEWMGYALLFETMLDSLLAARDTWLAPGGALLPDRASISLAGADSRAFGTTFWQDVYGFSMAPMGDELAAAAGREGQVLVRPVELAALVTPSVRVHDMDLVTMTPGQQDFTAIFTLTPAAGRDGSSGSVSVSAIVLWFDVEFSERFCRECPVTLSTSPAAECTHWAQAVLPLKQPVQLAADGSSSSSSLACRLSMARNRGKHRCLDISLEVTPAGGDDSARQTVVFSMGVNSSN